MITAVKSFLNTVKLHEDVNITDITLIPKIANPTLPSQYRPISLCNFSYTSISKVLANRLESYLSEIITPFQSAFVTGRMIQDNIIIAHEVFHYLRIRRHGKKVECAIKLDMQKVYDQVEWNILLEVLAHKGFNDTWINWIRECISTVYYSVLISGERSKP